MPIGLKRRLQLDDGTLDDLIYAKKLAVDEDDRMLVWTGGTAGASPPPAPLPNLAGSRRSAPQPHRRRPRRNGASSRFCDLADSTRLATQLDAEDLREVMLAYQETCGEVLGVSSE